MPLSRFSDVFGVLRRRDAEAWLELVPEILGHLAAAYPFEGCGVVRESASALRVIALKNIASRPASEFEFDLREWAALLADTESTGDRIAAVFHSHVDGTAEFSSRDSRSAAPNGTPLLDGVVHLVAVVNRDGASFPRVYEWDGQGYMEIAL